jgi:molybdopterin synthase sulfur carrier subunit
MPQVFIPAQLRGLTGGAQVVELEGRTVRQLVTALEARFPGIAVRLTEEEQLSRSLIVSIDGVMNPRGLLAAVEPTSEVHFLPAIGGG